MKMRGGRETYEDALHRCGQLWDAGVIDRAGYLAHVEAATWDMRTRGHGIDCHTFPHLFLVRKETPIWLHSLVDWILPICSLRFFQELYASGRLPTVTDKFYPLALEGGLINKTAPSIVQYMHEHGYIDARPHKCGDDRDWHPFYVVSITREAMRFCLSLGWQDYDRKTKGSDATALVHYLSYDLEHKAEVIGILLDHGGFKQPLSRCTWLNMDLATILVLERHYAFDMLKAWIDSAIYAIAMDMEHFGDVWPYLMRRYDVCFSEVYIGRALYRAHNLNAGNISWDNLINEEWLCNAFSRESMRRSFVQRLALILMYNKIKSPYLPDPYLERIDAFLVWKPEHIRWFSLPLRNQVRTLLLACYRQFGSTKLIKPLIPAIVGYIVAEPRVPTPRVANNSICCCF
jgi:hypothetical protein